MKFRALWHVSPERSELRESALTRPDAGDHCLIEALYSLVSVGTERLVATGQVPPTLQAEMAVPYMEGSLALPVKYGYSLVARVAEGPTALRGCTVHLLHPHQDRAWVAQSALFSVPDHVPAPRAALASNLETAVNAVWDGRVTVGDRVLVVGFGIIGALLAAVLARIPALRLVIAELDPERRRLAASLGFPLWSGDEGSYDVAFNTSASGRGLQACIDALGFEGTAVELSWYGQALTELSLGRSFHNQRKRIVSSQVSSLPPERARRWDYRSRKAVVFSLLGDPLFDRFLTDVRDFADAPALFDELRRGEQPPLGSLLRY